MLQPVSIPWGWKFEQSLTWQDVAGIEHWNQPQDEISTLGWQTTLPVSNKLTCLPSKIHGGPFP